MYYVKMNGVKFTTESLLVFFICLAMALTIVVITALVRGLLFGLVVWVALYLASSEYEQVPTGFLLAWGIGIFLSMVEGIVSTSNESSGNKSKN